MPGNINKGGVRFTADVEKERTQNAQEARRKNWELLSTTSLVQAVHFAKEKGWKDKKVQVRKEGNEFFVEPWEKDCTCPNILKYSDYFDPSIL